MKSALAIALGLLLAAGAASASDAPTQGKVCTTLGKVHAQRDQRLFPVSFQAIDGKLSTRRGDACITLAAGKYVIGVAAAPSEGAFPQTRWPRHAIKEKELTLEVVAGHTYTIAAQIKDRSQVDWMPIVQSDEVWASAR
jgi:hypothetical protein